MVVRDGSEDGNGVTEARSNGEVGASSFPPTEESLSALFTAAESAL